MNQHKSQWVPLAPATVRMMGLEQMARATGTRRKRMMPVRWMALVLAKMRPGV
jgi:hypothetical protein